MVAEDRRFYAVSRGSSSRQGRPRRLRACRGRTARSMDTRRSRLWGI